MTSQLGKRLAHGYDSNGQTPYTAGEKAVPFKVFTEDAGGQSFDFKTVYFPTGTNFALSATPAGMSLNASTGALTGTPTTVSASAAATITVTYATPVGSRVRVVPWGWAVADDAVADGVFVNAVADDYDFAALFPGAVGFGLSALPPGMTLDKTTGLLSGTPTTHGATVTLTVLYPDGQSTTRSWTYATSLP